jgi:hypothetical protein
VAGLEKRLENSGDQAQAALALSLREAENRQADLARRLDESTKNEDELRDGLAHQQARVPLLRACALCGRKYAVTSCARAGGAGGAAGRESA